MTIRDDVREFMAVSETLLNGALSVEELTDIELDLVQYYVVGMAQRFQVITESETSRRVHYISTQPHRIDHNNPEAR